MSQLSDQGQIKYSQLSCLDDVILGLLPCDVSFIGNFQLRKKKRINIIDINCTLNMK